MGMGDIASANGKRTLFVTLVCGDLREAGVVVQARVIAGKPDEAVAHGVGRGQRDCEDEECPER